VFDISIIIPTWNRLWCLPQAIESCRQNVCSTEIIVIDDGSTDGTWEWLQSQKDVISIRQPNWGKDWAVNKGLSVSRGEFVRFLDSDDLLPAHANDRQLEIARRDQADVVVAGHISWDAASGTKRRVEWVECDDFIAQQLGECDSSHYSAYLFKRHFIQDIPHRQEFAFRDDRLFVIEVALKHPKIAICTGPCLVHRHHGADRLQFPQGMRSVVTNWSHLQLYKKAAALLSDQGQLDMRRKRAIARALWPLAHWIAYIHADEAREVAAWIYQLDPDFQPPETGILGYLYRYLGFAMTERILRVRRGVLASYRGVRKAMKRGGQNPRSRGTPIIQPHELPTPANLWRL
jgi:glycosyltransferase involved in cell wall biosynthesis